LARAQLQFLHDRNRSDTDHGLVGEIDQHKQEEQNNHQPSLPGRLRALNLAEPGVPGQGLRNFHICGSRHLGAHRSLGMNPEVRFGTISYGTIWYQGKWFLKSSLRNVDVSVL
jgi:hypothetical protein